MITPTTLEQTPLLVSCGRDAGKGNLVGVQPWLTPADYATAPALCGALAPFFRLARRANWLSQRTVVVLPEYLGTWLVAVDAPAAVYHARTIARATPWIVAAHLPAFLRALHAARSGERLREALFCSRAAAMARTYQAVFSRLASEHRVTIVAGSRNAAPVSERAPGGMMPT